MAENENKPHRQRPLRGSAQGPVVGCLTSLAVLILGVLAMGGLLYLTSSR